MSSELIGELGQVGLKIGDPTSAVTAATDCYSGDEKKKPRLSSRPKKFRQAWMMFDIFKDWLRPHTSPEFATCIVCNRVIKAGKSELEKHAAGKRHQMLRGNVPSTTTVLIGQELISQSELPVSISINAENGGSAAPVNVDEYTSVQCIDTGTYTNIPNDGNPVSSTETYHQPVQRHHQIIAPQPQMELTTKAVVSRQAPPWKATAIVNGHVTRLDLTDYRGRYLILFFYPQDFNRVCASEINALSDRVAEFRMAQTEIVACSVDSHLSHLAWGKLSRQDGGVGNPKIPLLADPTHSIAKDYGVLMLEKGHTLRATYVIDKRGVLRAMNIYDTAIGRGIDELLRTVKALQYSDETEEAVPADWSPSHQGQ